MIPFVRVQPVMPGPLAGQGPPQPIMPATLMTSDHNPNGMYAHQEAADRYTETLRSPRSVYQPEETHRLFVPPEHPPSRQGGAGSEGMVKGPGGGGGGGRLSSVGRRWYH